MSQALFVLPRLPQLPAQTCEEVAAVALCRRSDESHLPFETTAELEPLTGRVGQERAVEALEFGVSVRHEGYNLFAMGPAHAGKHTAVRRLLADRASKEPVPDDLCYVTDFEQPQVPRLLRLPAGQGASFQRDVAQLVAEIEPAIAHALESDEHHARRDAIDEEFKERHGKELERLAELARQKQLAIVQTPMGLVLAPAKDGEVIPGDEFAKLPEDERKAFQVAIDALGAELKKHAEEIPRWHQEARRRLRALVQQTVRAGVSHLIEDLKTKYRALPAVMAHLDALGDQVVEHGAEMIQGGDESPSSSAAPTVDPEASPRRAWEVNLLVDNAATRGAPVVFEDHPTVDNLLGRVEHRTYLGTLVTDLQLIKAGALHRANGGYLILDARDLLSQPLAWDALKRALLGKQIRIESLGQMMSLVATVSLEPEPVPLEVKVVLLGERFLFYLLEEADPDFRGLFKAAVDFEDDVDRTPDNDVLYARMLATLARDEKLRPLDRAAVAAMLDHCSRIAGDSNRLTASMGTMVDLLREADHFAGVRAAQVVGAADVQDAIAARRRRAGRVHDRILAEIEQGTLLIETSGARAGQINGLSVVELGDCAYGHPTRITARVRAGQGRVVDIEREADLGGPIHSKGVLILSGFLAGRYAGDRPLSLTATLVFEQSYGHVEGDSASSAELYALLSALADVPLAQSIAVTGSVNQHGDIQPVGAVNEKIEGFFDVCRARGLTGRQGVVIPAANVRHLMLRPEVVDAVRAGRFHVWPVRHVDEGMDLLTGMAAGQRGSDGRFARGTVNARVEERLLGFARAFEAASHHTT